MLSNGCHVHPYTHDTQQPDEYGSPFRAGVVVVVAVVVVVVVVVFLAGRVCL